MRNLPLKGGIIHHFHRCADQLNVLADGRKGLALGTRLLRMAVRKPSIEDQLNNLFAAITIFHRESRLASIMGKQFGSPLLPKVHSAPAVVAWSVNGALKQPISTRYYNLAGMITRRVVVGWISAFSPTLHLDWLRGVPNGFYRNGSSTVTNHIGN